MKTEIISVKDTTKERIDIFLSNEFPNYTRSYWNNMIKHGHVLINDEKQKAGYQVSFNDRIRINWPAVTNDYSKFITEIYSDDDIVIIDKPAGMLVHSKGEFNPEFTVADYIQEKYELTGFSDDSRAGIVHRLDRNTSGIMIIAKNSETQKYLQKQFSDRKVFKSYIAVVKSKIKDDQFDIDIPIARSKNNPKTFTADSNGKDSITKVQVVSYDKNTDCSVLLLMPKTGRTHQLRVHMSHIGHPIVGDTAYGSKIELENSRFLLHAYSVGFRLPDNDFQKFNTKIPSDMTTYIHDEHKQLIDRIVDQNISR